MEAVKPLQVKQLGWQGRQELVVVSSANPSAQIHIAPLGVNVGGHEVQIVAVSTQVKQVTTQGRKL